MKGLKYFASSLVLIPLVFLSGCTTNEPLSFDCFDGSNVSDRAQCPEETQYCGSMSLGDAIYISKNSECGDNLKPIYICNDVTGTWWIDLDIEREGCNPACVINVETGEAEINWRCTGLITGY